MIKNNFGTILGLNLLLMIYSLSGVCSKFASTFDFFCLKFIILYGLMVLLLGIYALYWQQFIKKLPLSVAYANKSITVVWGIIWGIVFFHEKITTGNVIGALIVIFGIVLFVNSGDREST